VLFLTFTHMSMFGLVITLAPRLIYDPSFCLGAFGLTSLDDQRLGGILMAVCGGLPCLLGAVVILWRFLEFDALGAQVGRSTPTRR
jgi:putative membrane protein